MSSSSKLDSKDNHSNGQDLSSIPNIDDSDDEDVNQGTEKLGDSLDSYQIDESVGEEEQINEENHGNRFSLTSFIVKIIEKIIGNLSPRWQNWIIRGCSGFTLISGFSILISLGPAGLIFLTYLVVLSSLSEVMNLACQVTKPNHPDIQKITYWLFIIHQYYYLGPNILSYLILNCSQISCLAILMDCLIHNHLCICFTLYMSVIIWFVLTLNEHYIRSYAYLSWCHMAILFLGTPAFMLNTILFQGMIWYVLPMTLITLNDIAAYYVGFFVGKTPLIKLSPKKTQEGFIGGGLITVLLGTLITYSMMTPYLVSPILVNDLESFFQGEKNLFEIETHKFSELSIYKSYEFKILGSTLFNYYSFVMHGFFLSIIFSLIGPFGGFFASGFKRGCKRKNFGSFIPGHGGVLDRCDCMMICGVIIYIYHKTFINN